MWVPGTEPGPLHEQHMLISVEWSLQSIKSVLMIEWAKFAEKRKEKDPGYFLDWVVMFRDVGWEKSHWARRREPQRPISHLKIYPQIQAQLLSKSQDLAVVIQGNKLKYREHTCRLAGSCRDHWSCPNAFRVIYWAGSLSCSYGSPPIWIQVMSGIMKERLRAFRWKCTCARIMLSQSVLLTSWVILCLTRARCLVFIIVITTYTYWVFERWQTVCLVLCNIIK